MSPAERPPEREQGEWTAAPGVRLVGLLARIVPTSHRADWQEDWQAELVHAWEHPRPGTSALGLRIALLARACGSCLDAIAMRRTDGGGRACMNGSFAED